MRNSFIELEIGGMDGRERKVVLPAGGAIKIGSEASSDVVIEHPDVAPCQARLLFDEEIVIIEPASAADGRYGVRLDGKSITAATRVRAGQTMALGPAVLRWRWVPSQESPTIPAKRTPRGKSAVVQLVEEVKRRRYLAGSEVGRGGMGRILQAEETSLRRPVAMKVLLTSEKGQRHAEERFIREARVTGGLQHPSIVPVHELNVDETGRVFYTMKLVKGLTLREVLSRLASGEPEARRSYRLSSLLTIFQKVCDAVAFAHAQPSSIIHRDLKPDNIMIGEYGEVLVMDWGLAKVLGRDDPREDDNNDANGDELDAAQGMALLVTQPGTAMGTPGYMAPEQALGQAAMADERTDIYALGAILYALMTLESPAKITAKEAHDFQQRWQAGEEVTQNFRGYVAPLVSDRSRRKKLDHLPGRTVPDSLAAVVLKAMDLRPEHRFESVKKLQADVAAYQSGFATSAEEARTWKRFKLLVARNKTLFTAIAITFAMLLTATVISLQQRQTAFETNKALQLTLQRASLADLETARQRFSSGAWREGIAFLGRSLSFWPDNREAANYLLSAIAFGRGNRDQLPIFGVYHGDQLEEGAFSPDGRYFVTASDDGTARLWDSSTGDPVGQPLRHSAPVWCVRFTTDGSKVVTADEKGVARIWDSHTGEPLAKPLRHGEPDVDILSTVETAVFSRDGHKILTGCWDHTARLWNADNGNLIAKLMNPNRVAAAVFSPDETRILVSYWNGGATLWDAKSFKPIGTPMAHSSTVRRSIFTPDGNKIVTSSFDKTARIWDGHTALPLSAPIQHEGKVIDLDISPDGKLLVTACDDRAARLWSLANGTSKGPPMEHDGTVNTAFFSPGGERLVTASVDKTVRLWDVAIGKQIGYPMHHDDMVVKAVFSPDGRKVLSVGADNAAYVWDSQSAMSFGEIIPICDKVSFVDFMKDGEDQVLIATRDGNAGVWSLNERKFTGPCLNHGGEIAMAAFHRPTKRLATAGPDGVIRFWDSATGLELGQTEPPTAPLLALEFASDGKSLIAAYQQRTICQWKLGRTVELGATMKLATNSQSLAAAPEGNEIAMTCGGGNDLVQFWNPSMGALCRKPITYNGTAVTVTYHPGGHLIATGCADRTARLWSLDSGQQQSEPFHLNGRGTAVRFTAAGDALLVGGREDTEVNCYNTKTHESLCVPLSHPTGVSHITSNADGSLVITVTNDGVARLWRIPMTSVPPPKWLQQYLKALGGLSFSAQQQLGPVSTRNRLELRKELLSHAHEDSIWDAIMRWSFKRTETGAADPWSNAGR